MTENPDQQATSGARRPALDMVISPLEIKLKIDDNNLATEFTRGAAGLSTAALVARNIARSSPAGRAAVVSSIAVATVTVSAINYFWSNNKEKAEERIRRGLKKGSADPDLEVTEIRGGCLHVKLRCHTPRSFLQFISDYESQKVKEHLEEELSKVGFTGELTITIENLEQVEEQKKKLRYVTDFI